jgi:hypothetical protein
MMNGFTEYIKNNFGNCEAVVEAYYPDTQTISVVIMPDRILTTDIPVGTNFAGNGWGEIKPFYKGQQLYIGFIGDINNAFVLGTKYNDIDKPPVTGIREKYGNLTGKVIDPAKDYCISMPNSTILLSSNGVAINSDNKIDLVGYKPMNLVAPDQNIMGNININNDTNANETVTDNTKKINDLDEKLALIQSKVDAVSFQIEKFGSLVQLLTFVVYLIGLTPLKSINIYALYPALANCPFIKFFKTHMTELKAIQMWGSEVTDIFIDSANDLGISKVTNQIQSIKSTINTGSNYIDYVNYIDADPIAYMKTQVSRYDNLIIEDIPAIGKVKNAALQVTNKISRLISVTRRFYDLVKKTQKRITNSAYFRKTSIIGDFGTEDTSNNSNEIV